MRAPYGLGPWVGSSASSAGSHSPEPGFSHIGRLGRVQTSSLGFQVSPLWSEEYPPRYPPQGARPRRSHRSYVAEANHSNGCSALEWHPVPTPDLEALASGSACPSRRLGVGVNADCLLYTSDAADE